MCVTTTVALGGGVARVAEQQVPHIFEVDATWYVLGVVHRLHKQTRVSRPSQYHTRSPSTSTHTTRLPRNGFNFSTAVVIYTLILHTYRKLRGNTCSRVGKGDELPNRWDKHGAPACWINRILPDSSLPANLTPFELLLCQSPHMSLNTLFRQMDDAGHQEG